VANSVGVGVGIDSTTVNSAQNFLGQAFTTIAVAQRATYRGFVSIGYHAFNWLERGAASGTTTFYGDNGGAGLIQSGMRAMVTM
jgi:hypothetical protein